MTNSPSAWMQCNSTLDDGGSVSDSPPNSLSTTDCLPSIVRDHCLTPIQRHVTSSAIASNNGRTRPCVMALMMFSTRTRWSMCRGDSVCGIVSSSSWVVPATDGPRQGNHVHPQVPPHDGLLARLAL